MNLNTSGSDSASPAGTGTLSLNAGSALAIRGTNGLANEPFVLLGSTNLALPVANWMPVLTNAFDNSGNFNVGLTLSNNVPQQFYRVMLQ